MRGMRGWTLAAAAALGAMFAAPAWAEAPGVTGKEVVLGTHQDLSGPITAWGVAVRNGMNMAFGEVNAAGGVHGRTIRVIVEDNGYDPKKAVLATIKLLNRDNVFAMISTLGSPTTLAAMPQVLKKGRPHLFPVTAAVETFEPFDTLKFASFTPYQYVIALGTAHLMDEKGLTKVGTLVQDDDFGANVRDGAKLTMNARGLTLVEETTYKRGATDFATQIAKLRAAGVELVVLGTVVRETVGALQAAQALGWTDVTFLCSTACYTPETVDIGGATVNGLYGMGQYPVPYADDPNPAIRAFVTAYEKAYPEKASAQALTGYANAKLFAAALDAAGPDVTVEGFVKALEDLPPWTLEGIGGVPIDFTASDHLGAKQAFVARVQDGRWVTLTEPLTYVPAE